MSLAPTAFVPSAGLVVLESWELREGPLSWGLSTPDRGWLRTGWELAGTPGVWRVKCRPFISVYEARALQSLRGN